jgi:hypothetical protein
LSPSWKTSTTTAKGIAPWKRSFQRLVAILPTLENIPHSFLAIAGRFPPIGTGTTMAAASIAVIPAGVFAMDKQPSFARCKLHLSCIIRNPSRFAFYAGGIIREFKQATGFALCVALGLFVFGLSLVNSFFQH